jgi:NAD(P)-dependent dehydrogenase (short-subunit alcohol dehydrogenase family)
VDLGLRGKAAIVTGASEGIGRAVVEALAAEGADVAFCARRQPVLDEVAEAVGAATGRRLVPIAADVSRLAEVERFVAAAADALGGIDVVVNNAGASVFAELLDIPDERWMADLELKLMSYVRTSRAAIPHLRRRGGGRIVNVGGNAGRQPLPYHLPGGASNAAILNLTVALGKALARDRIHVLTCAPGPVRTARFAKQLAANARRWGVSLAEAEERFVAELPLGYVPSAEEVAGVVAFLASPRAAYMTGTTVTVDGGLTHGI